MFIQSFMQSKNPGLLYGSVQMGHIRNYYIFSFQKLNMLERKIFFIASYKLCAPYLIHAVWQSRAFSPCVLQSTRFPAISMHCHTWPLCQIVWELSCARFLCSQLLPRAPNCIWVCVYVLIWQGSRMMQCHCDVRVQYMFIISQSHQRSPQPWHVSHLYLRLVVWLPVCVLHIISHFRRYLPSYCSTLW